MGLSVSGAVAILFLDTIERRALINNTSTILYRRYVDDVFALVQNREDATLLHRNLNSQHPTIKFEVEHPQFAQPNSASLSLLDLTVNITNREVSYNFYRKAARSSVFLNHRSAIPLSQKQTTILNEASRIAERCTTAQNKCKQLSDFERRLKINGFPPGSLLAAQRQRQRRKHGQQSQQQQRPFYLSIPFLSDSVNTKLKRIFNQEGVPIRIVHRSKTLQQALRRKATTEECSSSNCQMPDKKICMRLNVVYQNRCNSCNN